MDKENIELEIKKALQIATTNIEFEEDMNEITYLEKNEIVENLVHDEEIRGKALKKVIEKNDV